MKLIEYSIVRRIEKLINRMAFKGNTAKFKIICLFIFAISLSACDEFIIPTNQLTEYYVSPKASEYEIRTVDILPMSKDDTTNTGTFYSTNHLINRLEKLFPDIKFSIPSIDSLTNEDSLLVSRVAESIEPEKKLTLKEFNSTVLGSIISKDKPDAIIIGKVNNVSYRKGVGLVNDEFLHFEFRAITTCDFTYYLVSLTDGEVIWRVHVVADAVNKSYHTDNDFPPVDMAISNGIDLILRSTSSKNGIQ